MVGDQHVANPLAQFVRAQHPLLGQLPVGGEVESKGRQKSGMTTTETTYKACDNINTQGTGKRRSRHQSTRMQTQSFQTIVRSARISRRNTKPSMNINYMHKAFAHSFTHDCAGKTNIGNEIKLKEYSDRQNIHHSLLNFKSQTFTRTHNHVTNNQVFVWQSMCNETEDNKQPA